MHTFFYEQALQLFREKNGDGSQTLQLVIHIIQKLINESTKHTSGFDFYIGERFKQISDVVPSTFCLQDFECLYKECYRIHKYPSYDEFDNLSFLEKANMETIYFEEQVKQFPDENQAEDILGPGTYQNMLYVNAKNRN